MNTRLFSMSSRGARVQFDIAVVLTSIIPLLTLGAFLAMGIWHEMGFWGAYNLALVIVITLVIAGYALLSKYPMTIIKLRRYLEDMVNGDLPIEIHLEENENDITAIENCMNMILDKLKSKVAQMELEQVKLELQLCQAQKLESIGELASGMAHEINTPIQFVSDNTRFLSKALKDILRVLDAHREVAMQCAGQPISEDTQQRLRVMEEDVDLSFLESEIPLAIEQSLEGLGQAAAVARAMKDFSYRVNAADTCETDVNKAIETTVTVTRNEWKHVAVVTTDLDPALPLVDCFPNDIKQALVNLIVNAAHAVGDAVNHGEDGKGQINIRSQREGDAIVITVADTGTGIPEGIRDQIFDRFFTSKAGGEGSGQGLPIARSIIENKHNGTLTFESEEGEGTTFTIRLPIERVSPEANCAVEGRFL